MIALLLIYPFLDESVGSRLPLGLLNAASLTAAGLAIGRSRPAMLVTLPLWVATVLLQMLHMAIASRSAYLLFSLTFSAFYVVVICILLRYVLQRGPVTADKLYAAASSYILLGLVWASFYTILYELRPAAFVATTAGETQRALGFFDFIYVSFGCLTSAGYNGIDPDHRPRAIIDCARRDRRCSLCGGADRAAHGSLSAAPA